MEERSVRMQVKIKSIKYEEFNDNEYLEQLRASGTNVIVGCLDDVINWGRSNSLWPLTFAKAVVVLNSWQWERHVMISPVSGSR